MEIKQHYLRNFNRNLLVVSHINWSSQCIFIKKRPILSFYFYISCLQKILSFYFFFHTGFQFFYINFIMRVYLTIFVLIATWADLIALNNDVLFSNFLNNYFQSQGQKSQSLFLGDTKQIDLSRSSKSISSKIASDGSKTTIQTTTFPDGSKNIVETVIRPDGTKSVSSIKSPELSKNISEVPSNLNTKLIIDMIKPTYSNLSVNTSSKITEFTSATNSSLNNQLGKTTIQTKIDPDGKKTITKSTIGPDGRKTIMTQTSWDYRQAQSNSSNKSSLHIEPTTINTNIIKNDTQPNTNTNRQHDFFKLFHSDLGNRINSNPPAKNIKVKQNISQKQRAQLKMHNEYRSRHGVAPLQISQQLTKIAQGYANRLDSLNQFSHSGNKYLGESLGENLYSAFPPPNGGQATTSWYDQIKMYTWNGLFSPATGHFTQVIWKGSRYIGFGYSGGIVVANYYPAGNFMGRFQQNVLKPIK